MAENALAEHRRYGIRYFKLKPIGDPDSDIETLRRMREAMGPDVRYYMDANYALQITDPDKIVDYMNDLHALGLEVYEDPVDAEFAVYRYIRERTSVRLMLDDKARTPAAVLDIVREKCADQINVHANWASGFQPALRKAALAWMGGMPTMVGSTYYLGPGSAAYQILSSVLPGNVPCEQKFSAHSKRGVSAVRNPFDLRDGKYTIADRPGLGVDVDMEIVDDLTVRKQEIDR